MEARTHAHKHSFPQHKARPNTHSATMPQQTKSNQSECFHVCILYLLSSVRIHGRLAVRPSFPNGEIPGLSCASNALFRIFQNAVFRSFVRFIHWCGDFLSADVELPLLLMQTLPIQRAHTHNAQHTIHLTPEVL